VSVSGLSEAELDALAAMFAETALDEMLAEAAQPDKPVATLEATAAVA